MEPTEKKTCSFCIKDAVERMGVTTMRESIWWDYCEEHHAKAELERDIYLMDSIGKIAAQIPENHEVKLS